jgi:hypothetical protein
MENPKPSSNVPLQDEQLDKVVGGVNVPIQEVNTVVGTPAGDNPGIFQQVFRYVVNSVKG